MIRSSTGWDGSIEVEAAETIEAGELVVLGDDGMGRAIRDGWLAPTREETIRDVLALAGWCVEHGFPDDDGRWVDAALGNARSDRAALDRWVDDGGR